LAGRAAIPSSRQAGDVGEAADGHEVRRRSNVSPVVSRLAKLRVARPFVWSFVQGGAFEAGAQPDEDARQNGRAYGYGCHRISRVFRSVEPTVAGLEGRSRQAVMLILCVIDVPPSL
jgi:hypothetical protein